MTEVWTEKYRPKRLDEVVNQRHVVERLKEWVKTKEIPHMIFAGPAGTGKTTIALCLARELFGELWRECILETNASDERGIDTVRNKIKEFARTKPIGANFKIIFLDEADSLTADAQHALRRTIERFSDIARFILSCNYSSRIIEPIQSRAAVFRFLTFDEKDIESYIKKIADAERLDITVDGMKAISKLCEGDMRKAINLLQACSMKKKIDAQAVYEIAGQVKSDDVKEMIEQAMSGKFAIARARLLDMLFKQGLSGDDVLRAIHRHIQELEISDEEKAEAIEKLADFEFRIIQGGSPDIQLSAFLAYLSKNKKRLVK
ncbi:MAG: replication factor C small subunit [Candidatus Aenigmatarchaeota archaeon]